MKFAKTKFYLIELQQQQQQQRLENVISNLAQTLPLSQRNGCLPCVVLSKPSVGIKTCFIESGSTLKAPNLSCLAESDRKVKTLLTITL